jgi:hypothetical protein
MKKSTKSIGRRFRGMVVAVAGVLTIATAGVVYAAAPASAAPPCPPTGNICHYVDTGDIITDVLCNNNSLYVTHYFAQKAHNPNRIGLTRVTFQNRGSATQTIQPIIQDAINQTFVPPNSGNGQIVVGGGRTFEWRVNRTLRLPAFDTIRFATAFSCQDTLILQFHAAPSF